MWFYDGDGSCDTHYSHQVHGNAEKEICSYRETSTNYRVLEKFCFTIIEQGNDYGNACTACANVHRNDNDVEFIRQRLPFVGEKVSESGYISQKSNYKTNNQKTSDDDVLPRARTRAFKISLHQEY